MALSASAKETLGAIAALFERAAGALRAEGQQREPDFQRGLRQCNVFVSLAHNLETQRTSVFVTAPYRITRREVSQACHELMHAGLSAAVPDSGMN